eukprot:4925373-Prymnesium_polylepis.1
MALCQRCIGRRSRRMRMQTTTCPNFESSSRSRAWAGRRPSRLLSVTTSGLVPLLRLEPWPLRLEPWPLRLE